MKKVLSLAITLCLLISSIFSVLVVPTSATADADYFETAENWNTLYGDDVVGQSTTNRVPISRVTTGTYDNGDAAIAFTGAMHNRNAAIKLPVETGKTYKISFMYRSDLNGSSTSYSIPRSGVYASGTTMISGEGPGGTAIASHAAITGVTDTTSYFSYDLTFTVENNTDLYFILYFTGATWVYIDNFELKDITPTYYEIAENWKALKGGDVVGTSATSTVPVKRVTSDTYNSGEAAICYAGTMHNQAAAIALPVEAGRTYKLSLQYKADYSSSYTDYDMTSGVYEAGASIVSGSGINGTAVATYANQTSVTEKTYRSYELTFTVDENTDLYFVAWFWTATWVWFDEVVLKDVTPTYYEIAENWNTLYGDDVVGESTTNRVTIDRVTTETYENGAAAIRFSGTMHNRSAAIQLPVEAGKTYKLSFKYKADINTAGGSTAHYIAKSGVYEKSTTIVSGTGPDGVAVAELSATSRITDTSDYHPYEIDFTVGTNTDLYFVAHFWGATWVWIDEVELTCTAEASFVETTYNSKAAIRAAGNTDGSINSNGLRTYNAIESNWVDADDSIIVEYGSFAIRQGYLESKFGKKTDPEFNTVAIDDTGRTLKELVGKGVGIGVSYRAAETETGTELIAPQLWDNNNADGEVEKDIFTAYLTGITPANYGEEYLVRAYAIDNKGNIYYGKTASVSIFKVAQAISVANNEEAILDNAAFEAFVGEQIDTYAQWCADNELEVGGLYTALINQ